MKRIALGLVIAAAIGSAGGVARAECAALGPYDRASLTFEDANGTVTIYAEQFGNLATGPAFACDDASAGTEAAARPLMTITVNGEERCRRTDPAARLSVDPFQVIGAAVRAREGACGAEISWMEGGPSAGVEDVSAGTGGVFVGRRRAATAGGQYWLDGSDPIQIAPTDEVVGLPLLSRAWVSRGVRVAIE